MHHSWLCDSLCGIPSVASSAEFAGHFSGELVLLENTPVDAVTGSGLASTEFHVATRSVVWYPAADTGVAATTGQLVV